MIIHYEGRQYQFDMDDLTVRQGLQIEKFMGCSFAEWGKRLTDGDLRARQVLGWLILHPDDGTAIEDTDFKMVALAKALEAATAAEAGPEDGEVPTGAVLNGRVPAESSPAI